MSPTMPLPYSMKARQPRGWTMRIVGPHGRRAGPHFVVEIFRRPRVGRVVAGPHVIVAVDFDQAHAAQFAFADDAVAGLDEVRRAAALRAHLDDAAVLPRGGEHCLPLDHVDADRLLQVDVGPRFHGGDHRQGVPMVGRGDEHDVEVFFREHLAIIGVGPRPLLRGLPRGDQVGRGGKHPPVDVAQRDDVDRRHLDQAQQVDLAVPAGADQADVRGGFAAANAPAVRPRAERAKPAVPARRKLRRCMGSLGEVEQFVIGRVSKRSGSATKDPELLKILRLKHLTHLRAQP